MCTVPASGDAHENLHFPLAGILSSADNSACGNATKILHLRERIFCNYFGSRSRLRKCTISCVSPRAEIRSGRRISASRKCKRMCAVPQAVLQEIRSFLIPGHCHRPRRLCSHLNFQGDSSPLNCQPLNSDLLVGAQMKN